MGNIENNHLHFLPLFLIYRQCQGTDRVWTWKCGNIPTKPNPTGKWDDSSTYCKPNPKTYCKPGPFERNDHLDYKNMDCSNTTLKYQIRVWYGIKLMGGN